MSYNHNFNNHGQFPNQSHHPININKNLSNGINGNTYQVNDSADPFRRQATSSTPSQNLDMSVQLTRPTSKTAMLIRQRRAMLEQLSCFICKGYLIDATTIDECMDSFCKSCIVTHLNHSNNCPKCGTSIQHTNPLSSIRSDKVLQDIVYKLVPGLYDDEMQRRRDYYRNILGPSSDEEDDGSCNSFNGRSPALTGEQYGIISHPKPFYKPDDSIDLSIEPQTRNDGFTVYYDLKRPSIVTCFTGNSQQLEQLKNGSLFSAVDSQKFKTYLRCPAKFTVLQLKKFIAAKFNTSQDDTIHLLYLNESLKDEYSLIDVAYIYDWRGIEPMRLFYIIERDLGKSCLRSDQITVQNRISKPVQSVGTSTQTSKRVCIDPQPKFYEEQNNNGSSQSSTNSRSMRSRNETPAKPKVSSGTTRAPILRSKTPSKEPGMIQSKALNGNSGRARESSGVTQVVRSNYASTVTTAIDELNQMRRINQGQTSPSKGSTSNESTWIARGSSKDSSSRAQNSVTASKETTDSHVSKAQQNEGITSREVVALNDGSIRQLMPFVTKGAYVATTCVAGPSQSSMYTLSSYAEARSNQFVTLTTKPSSSLGSQTYRNLYTTSSQIVAASPDVKSSQVKSNDVSTSNSTPRSPYSFITERGIIIRCLENRDTKQISSSAVKASNTIPAITAPDRPAQAPTTSQTSNSNGTNSSVANLGIFSESIQSKPSQQRTPATNTLSTMTSTSVAGSSTQTSASANKKQSDIIATTARHQIRVKPVYRTFVDPTKIKSPNPNIKKFGHTAGRP